MTGGEHRGITQRLSRVLAILSYRGSDVSPWDPALITGPVLAVSNHFSGLADGVLGAAGSRPNHNSCHPDSRAPCAATGPDFGPVSVRSGVTTGPSRLFRSWYYPEEMVLNRFLSCIIALVCSWHARLSVTFSTNPTSARVKPS